MVGLLTVAPSVGLGESLVVLGLTIGPMVGFEVTLVVVGLFVVFSV